MNANIPSPNGDLPAYSPTWPTAPAGFADRVTAAVQVQHLAYRRRVWLVRAGGLALAASVAIAIALGVSASMKKPEMANVPSNPTPPKTEPIAPIQKPFTEAGEALVSITRKTTDKALAPTKTMVASAERLPIPNAIESNPTVETKEWADATESARIGLDPISSQPRRAMNRMLRDFGIATASKPRS